MFAKCRKESLIQSGNMHKAVQCLWAQEVGRLVYQVISAANGTFISFESVFFKHCLLSCSSLVLCIFSKIVRNTLVVFNLIDKVLCLFSV